MKNALGRRGLQRGAAALLALGIVVLAAGAYAGGARTGGPLAVASASPLEPSATPVPSGTETLPPVASESATPAPAAAHVAQEDVAYSPPPPATPTPSPDPQLWRYEGVVVDASGKPVEGVCIAVGPHGCQPSSPRTDKRGVWYIDFPQAPVDYDLHFAKAGFTTFDIRVTPTGPWMLNVVLKG